jgi:mRNA interferase MazF
MTLFTGEVVWADFGSDRGRVQAGRRPAIVVSPNTYLALATNLAMVVPVSTRDRGWPNHVALSGPSQVHGFAQTEQLQVIDRVFIRASAGSIDEECLRQIRVYLQDFLDL